MNLENRLRRALTREQPPTGFADRVMAGIEVAQRPPQVASPSITKRGLIGLATAAAIAMATGSIFYAAHRRHVSETERFRDEAVVGLRIASAKLNAVHDRLLQRINRQNEAQR